VVQKDEVEESEEVGRIAENLQPDIEVPCSQLQRIFEM
jgi:hypothetical protein